MAVYGSNNEGSLSVITYLDKRSYSLSLYGQIPRRALRVDAHVSVVRVRVVIGSPSRALERLAPQEEIGSDDVAISKLKPSVNIDALKVRTLGIRRGKVCDIGLLDAGVIQLSKLRARAKRHY